jgi:hypothetical protein
MNHELIITELKADIISKLSNLPNKTALAVLGGLAMQLLAVLMAQTNGEFIKVILENAAIKAQEIKELEP